MRAPDWRPLEVVPLIAGRNILVGDLSVGRGDQFRCPIELADVLLRRRTARRDTTALASVRYERVR